MGFKYKTIGDNFKKFNCHNCGKKVTRRTSKAIDTVADGYRTGSTRDTHRWLSKEKGGREITLKQPSNRVCKGRCKKDGT